MSCTQCQIRNVPSSAVLLPIQNQAEHFLYTQDSTKMLTVFDNDARYYFQKVPNIPLEEKININNFIVGLKDYKLWSTTTCWTLLKNQNSIETRATAYNPIQLECFGEYDFFKGQLNDNSGAQNTTFTSFPNGILFLPDTYISTTYPNVLANNSRSTFVITQNLSLIRNQTGYVVGEGTDSNTNSLFSLQLSADNEAGVMSIDYNGSSTPLFSAANVFGYSYDAFKGFLFWSSFPQQFSQTENLPDTQQATFCLNQKTSTSYAPSLSGVVYSFVLNTRRSLTYKDFATIRYLYNTTIGKEFPV